MLTTLGLVLLITLLFHTGFCGWLCPLGTMTDLVRALGKKIGGLSFLKPTNEKYLLWVKANKKLLNKIDGPARYIKYILLVWIFQAAFFSFGSIKEERQHGIFSVLQLVIALLVLGLFVDRAWYRYGCPLG
ncbi:MAG TPA: 4Fe-4S binding protein [Clostridia bacterium]|nr:4Fe-4S binding protein [Clostridia bacterium]